MLTRPESQARARAAELQVFAAGLDDGGHPETARRLRLAARDILDLVKALEAERSARRSIQEQRDTALVLLGKRGVA